MLHIMNDKDFHNIYEAVNVNFSCLRLQAHFFSSLHFPCMDGKFSVLKHIFNILANYLCFPCLEKWTSKFPVFLVLW